MGTISLPDPFTNLGTIGAGNFGTVVRARDRTLKRDVAIKLIPHHGWDHLTVKRFLGEAKRVARLQHPNVVTIHSAGIHDDHLYLVMEYATGGTLADQIPESGGIPMNDALRYLDEAAKGLDYAHMNGMVHQDVKPANLLVDAHGSVKVADFGLAREMDRSSATRGGTISYAAPEMWDPDAARTPAIDVFSLGVTAWEMLTGACHGGVARIASAGAEASSRISEILPGISRDADNVFANALVINPSRRTQSTTQFVNDLRVALATPPRRAASRPDSPEVPKEPYTVFAAFEDSVSGGAAAPQSARGSVLRDARSVSFRHAAALQAVRDSDWFVGVKWSGTAKPRQSSAGIWVAVVKDGVLRKLVSDFDREGATDFILEECRDAPRVTVGMDFGFSVPAWFIDAHGWSSATDLWNYLDDMEQGLGPLTQWPTELELPFWGPNIRTRPNIHPDADWFRATENDVRDMTGAVPKSVFQLTGAGSVGGMSVRGMPQLKRMREHGWHIWPFDRPASHMVVEVFPRALLLALVTPGSSPNRDDVRDDVLAGLPPTFTRGRAEISEALATNHTAFEAAFAAWSLWADGADLPDLSRDPVAQREGRIWLSE